MGVLGVGVRGHARALCSARSCLRWEECVVCGRRAGGVLGGRGAARSKRIDFSRNFPEIKVLSAEIKSPEILPTTGGKFLYGPRAHSKAQRAVTEVTARVTHAEKRELL